METREIVALVERVEVAGKLASLEQEFSFELNAIEHGDEGLVAAERIEQLAAAAKKLLGEDEAGAGERDKRRFFVTEITLQVLSEGEPVPGDMDITTVTEEMTDGEYSGMEIKREIREVGPVEMAALLRSQASDPEFFRLNDNGDELDY